MSVLLSSTRRMILVTRRIIDRLDASEYFSVTTNLNTPDEVEKSFRRGDIDLAVIFSEQFANHVYTGDACVQLVADATDPNTATTQTGYAANIISSAGREMLPARSAGFHYCSRSEAAL